VAKPRRAAMAARATASMIQRVAGYLLYRAFVATVVVCSGEFTLPLRVDAMVNI